MNVNSRAAKSTSADLGLCFRSIAYSLTYVRIQGPVPPTSSVNLSVQCTTLAGRSCEGSVFLDRNLTLALGVTQAGDYIFNGGSVQNFRVRSKGHVIITFRADMRTGGISADVQRKACLYYDPKIDWSLFQVEKS
jgi:hypothetical protein